METLTAPKAAQLADAVANDAGLDDAGSLRDLLNRVPALRRELIATAVRCLDARKYYYDRKQGAMVYEPDGTTQMRAVAFLAAYSDGLPAQTQIIRAIGGPNGKQPEMTLEDALTKSPALRDRLEELLARSREKRGETVEAE